MRLDQLVVAIERQIRLYGFVWHTSEPYIETAERLYVNGFVTWNDGAFFGVLEAIPVDSFDRVLYDYSLSYRRPDGRHCRHEIHNHPREAVALRYHWHRYCAEEGQPRRDKLPPHEPLSFAEALQSLIQTHFEEHDSTGARISLRNLRPDPKVVDLLKAYDHEIE